MAENQLRISGVSSFIHEWRLHADGIVAQALVDVKRSLSGCESLTMAA